MSLKTKLALLVVLVLVCSNISRRECSIFKKITKLPVNSIDRLINKITKILRLDVPEGKRIKNQARKPYYNLWSRIG